jgi:hypothetical protein
MKKLIAAAFLLLAATPASAADETVCGKIAAQAYAGLQSNQLHETVRDRLQRMLDTGLKGNIAQCLSVANGSLAEEKLPTCNEKPSV